MRRREQALALRIDVFIHDERIGRDPLIQRSLEAIMSNLDVLRAEVAQNRDVIDSAVQLLQGLKQQLDDAIATGDPAALVELSAELDSQTNRLAQAVQMNTPQPGVPDEPPAEPPAEPPQEPGDEPEPASFGTASAPATRRRTR